MKSPTKLQIQTLFDAEKGYKSISKHFGLDVNTVKAHNSKSISGLPPKEKLSKKSIRGHNALKVAYVHEAENIFFTGPIDNLRLYMRFEYHATL